jgi:hypothetical protein
LKSFAHNQAAEINLRRQQEMLANGKTTLFVGACLPKTLELEILRQANAEEKDSLRFASRSQKV